MAASIPADARRKANLRVLQRLDSQILDIAGSATHVVLYEFNTNNSQWEKTGCEGSLFVAKRSESPRFKLVILNRSSKNNLEVPITGRFQMQLQEPYLIFREAKIFGIWFHDATERAAVADLLQRVVSSLEQIEELEEKHKKDAEVLGVSKNQSLPPPTVAQMESLSISNSNAGRSASVGSEDVSDAAVAAGNMKQHPHRLILDKKSLQLSLLSLIQDERFLDLIHAQYLKVVHARSSREQKYGQGEGGGGVSGM